ncbi:MAG: TolC family protein [Deltaproteobacteria bacterium]|nr:TolC family protein [Deltaproteobacteria bacterium]
MRIFVPFLFCFSGSLIAESLDLRTAESVILEKSFDLKSDEENVRIAEENASAYYGKILPKLDVSQSFKDKGLPQTSVSVSEAVPYPLDWWKQKQIRDNSVAIASRTKSLKRQSLVNELRKLYFNVKLREKQREIVLQNLAIVENFRTESRERFANGFISESDRQRSEIDLLTLRQQLLKTDADLRSDKEKLGILLEWNTSFMLTTSMQLSDKFIALKEESLRQNLNMQESDNIAVRKLQSENADLLVESFPYRYLPEISLQAKVPIDREKSPPVYSASLTWNLFNGGVDRTEHRKALWAREQRAYEFHKQMQDFQIDGRRLIAQILERKSRYSLQNDAFKMYENIVASSQKRFHAGAISSQDLSLDIRSYLEHANLLYQTTYDALSSLADFALLVGKEELFYDFLY